MPELPEVETVMRGLQPVLGRGFIAQVEQRRADLRFPFPDQFVERLTDRQAGPLRRRAKYILAPLDSGETLIVHLGMSGRVVIELPGRTEALTGPNPAHDHVVLHMSSGARIRYNDPRRFGYMALADSDGLDAHKLFRDLGPEPLGNTFNADCLARAASGRATPVKNFLLDQKVVAGLGNIYVCEALFRAGLAPTRPARVLARKTGAPTKAAERLATAVRQVLREAIDKGGSTLRDHRLTDGSLGYFQHSFRVYGRAGETCRKQGCKGTIDRLVQSGRSTFYCPSCQK